MGHISLFRNFTFFPVSFLKYNFILRYLKKKNPPKLNKTFSWDQDTRLFTDI